MHRPDFHPLQQFRPDENSSESSSGLVQWYYKRGVFRP